MKNHQLKRFLYHKIIVAMLIPAATTSVYGQTFSISPNDSIVDSAPFSTISHFIIQQNNLTAGSLEFNWQLITLNLPTNWTGNLCDNASCFGSFPTSGIMNLVNSGDFGFVSIGIDPDTIPGTALIQYAVWESNTPAHIDTLTWVISANGTVGINETNKNGSVFVFPNPVVDLLSVQRKETTMVTVFLSDIAGRLVLQNKFSQDYFQIDVSSLPKATYLLKIKTDTREYNQKIIKQ